MKGAIQRRLAQFIRLFHREMASTNKTPYPAYSAHEPPLPLSEFLRFESRRAARIVTLDRPASLHALAYSMITDLTEALKIWARPDCSAKVIIFRGGPLPNGKRSFCAGGDVVALCKSRGRTRDQCEFFRREYALNHLIAAHPKPIVSLIDGIVMGGGAGLSIHGQFRIATENTVFAMPETAIGFWPDVGASFFLPRLAGGLGMYLGLTGARLAGQDVYHAGLATHFIPSHRLDDVIETLSTLPSPTTPRVIDQLLNQFSGDLQPFSLQPLVDTIDSIFMAPTLNEVMRRLRLAIEQHSSNPVIKTWAVETHRLLTEQSSPTAIHTTFKLIQKGASASFKTALNTEMNLAQNYVERVDDLYTGISAKLISKAKDTPAWNPPSIEQVRLDKIDALFQKASDPIHIDFINNVDFEEYPHSANALPTPSSLKKVVLSMKLSNGEPVEQLADLIVARGVYAQDKLGLRSHLQHILAKHVRSDDSTQRGFRWVN